MNVKIASNNHGFNCVCPRCNNAKETLVHVLRECMKSREILMLGGIDGRLLTSEWDTNIDWLETMIRLVDGKAFECLVMLLWNIWNSRNNLIFRGSSEDSKLVWESALSFCRDFRIHNLNNVGMVPKTGMHCRGSKPPSGLLKINFYATWDESKAVWVSLYVTLMILCIGVL